MVRPLEGQTRTTIKVRIYHDTYKTLQDVAKCRVDSGRIPAPSHAEIIEGLLETAFRCLEEHGSHFAKPYQPKEALKRATELVSTRVRKKNPPHRPVGSKDSKQRKRRNSS